MIFLLAFGPAVEAYMGKLLYPVFYMACGFGASLTHMALNQAACLPIVGTGGIVAGLMGAFLLLHPGARIGTLGLFSRLPAVLRNIPVIPLVVVFLLLDVVNGFTRLGTETYNTADVTLWAYVGGLLTGVVLTFLIKTLRRAPEAELLSLQHDGSV